MLVLRAAETTDRGQKHARPLVRLLLEAFQRGVEDGTHQITQHHVDAAMALVEKVQPHTLACICEGRTPPYTTTSSPDLRCSFK